MGRWALLGAVMLGAFLAACTPKAAGPAKMPGIVANDTKTVAVMCVNDCITKNQMRAVAIDVIESDCRASCAKACVDKCVAAKQMQAVGQAQIQADCQKSCGQ